MRLSLKAALALVVSVGFTACEATTTQPEVQVEPQFAKGGNGVVASASGSGVRAESARHFQFSAVAKADGTVNGRFNLTNEGSENFSGRGDVVCLSVSGNTAFVGTRITDSSVEDWIGTEGGFWVQDGGEGKGTEDLLSLAFFGGDPGFAQEVCDGLTGIDFSAIPIEAGNIQVR